MSEASEAMDQEGNLKKLNVISDLPKYIIKERFKKYLVIIDHFIVCVLCLRKFLLRSEDDTNKFKYLQEHLHSNSHKKLELELMPVGEDKLFELIHKSQHYNKIFISKNHDELFCKLCDIVIDVTHDTIQQFNSLKSHLGGQHNSIYFNELIQSLPNKDNDEYLVLKKGEIVCSLCSTNIKISLSLGDTVNDLKAHILGPVHSRLFLEIHCSVAKSENIEHTDEEIMINEIFSDIPEINRRYMIMDKSCKLFCQLCNSFMTLCLDDVFNHLKSSRHTEMIGKASLNPVSIKSNKIDEGVKLTEEPEKIVHEKYSVITKSKKIDEGVKLTEEPEKIVCEKYSVITKSNNIDKDIKLIDEPVKIVGASTENEKLRCKTSRNTESKNVEKFVFPFNKKITNYLEFAGRPLFTSLHRNVKLTSKTSKNTEAQDNISKLIGEPEKRVSEKYSVICKLNKIDNDVKLPDESEKIVSKENSVISKTKKIENDVKLTGNPKKIKTHSVISKSKQINKRVKLTTKLKKIVSKKHSNMEDNTFLNSEIKFRPLYIEGEINIAYDQLTRFLIPDLRQILEQNKHYIYLENDLYFCSLCLQQMYPGIFFEHLNEYEHNTKLNRDLMLFQGDGKTNKNYEYLKLIFNPELFSMVEENFCYLERMGNIFMCKLCSVYFPVEPILNLNYPKGGKLKKSLQKKFNKHFNSLDHSEAVESNVKEKFCTDVNQKKGNWTEINRGIEFCTSILNTKEDLERTTISISSNETNTNEKVISSYLGSTKLENEIMNLRHSKRDTINHAVPTRTKNYCSKFDSKSKILSSVRNSAWKDTIKPKFKTYDPIMNEVTVTVYTAFNRICDIFNSEIPDIIVRNIGYLVMKNCESFMCLICAAQLMVKDDAVDMENVFSQHFEGMNHKYNLKIYLESLPNQPRFLLHTLKLFLKSNKVYTSLRRIFGSVLPNIIHINKTVLSKCKRGFMCKLCGDFITFKNDINHAILQLSIHLESKKHYKKREDLRDDLVKFEKYVLGAFRKKNFSVLKRGRTLTNCTSSEVEKKLPISLKLCSKSSKILEVSGDKMLPFTVKNNSTINSEFTCEPQFVASTENENLPSDTSKNTETRDEMLTISVKNKSKVNYRFDYEPPIVTSTENKNLPSDTSKNTETRDEMLTLPVKNNSTVISEFTCGVPFGASNGNKNLPSDTSKNTETRDEMLALPVKNKSTMNSRFDYEPPFVTSTENKNLPSDTSKNTETRDEMLDLPVKNKIMNSRFDYEPLFVTSTENKNLPSDTSKNTETRDEMLALPVKNKSTMNSRFDYEPPFVTSTENKNLPSDTSKNTETRDEMLTLPVKNNSTVISGFARKPLFSASNENKNLPSKTSKNTDTRGVMFALPIKNNSTVNSGFDNPPLFGASNENKNLPFKASKNTEKRDNKRIAFPVKNNSKINSGFNREPLFDTSSENGTSKASKNSETRDNKMFDIPVKNNSINNFEFVGRPLLGASTENDKLHCKTSKNTEIKVGKMFPYPVKKSSTNNLDFSGRPLFPVLTGSEKLPAKVFKNTKSRSDKMFDFSVKNNSTINCGIAHGPLFVDFTENEVPVPSKRSNTERRDKKMFDFPGKNHCTVLAYEPLVFPSTRIEHLDPNTDKIEDLKPKNNLFAFPVKMKTVPTTNLEHLFNKKITTVASEREQTPLDKIIYKNKDLTSTNPSPSPITKNNEYSFDNKPFTSLLKSKNPLPSVGIGFKNENSITSMIALPDENNTAIGVQHMYDPSTCQSGRQQFPSRVSPNRNLLPNEACGLIIDRTPSTSTIEREELLSSLNIDKYLKDIFGPVLPKIIIENKAFLVSYSNGCICTLCDIVMQVPSISSNAICNFSQHLESYKHRDMVKKSRKKTAVPPFKNTFCNNKSTLLPETQKLDGTLKCKNIDLSIDKINSPINERFKTVTSDHKTIPPFTTNSSKSLTTHNNEAMIVPGNMNTNNGSVFFKTMPIFLNKKLPPFRSVNKNKTEDKQLEIVGSNSEGNEQTRHIRETHSVSREVMGNSSGTNVGKEPYFPVALVENLQNIIGGDLPEVIKTNMKHLAKINKQYICILCNKCIQCSPFPKITLDNFYSHLLSKQHMINVNKI